MKRKLVIAADHAGFDLKTAIIDHFSDIEWLDLGTHGLQSVDYPDFGAALARSIEAGEAAQGVLVCGSGIGISIAANRNRAVRCAVCSDSTTVRLARQHNDANVVALGARLVGTELAFDIVNVFLNTDFEGGRHEGRVKKLAC
ncbi:MAG: ribose 5-phosphate isomerase B [Alphaproteobacteria bacterium]|nr:ribose 5-phosphate isomerase B [Alphaproteobacteria bacterium]